MTEEEARQLQTPYTKGREMYARDPDPQCCRAQIFRRVGHYFTQCDRKPKVFYGSLGYCGIHDPQKILDKQDRWSRESARLTARNKYESAMREWVQKCVELVERSLELERMVATEATAIMYDYIGEVQSLARQKPDNQVDKSDTAPTEK